MIIKELSYPFNDPRGRFKPVSSKVLFYQLAGKPAELFKRESLIKCKISGIFRYNMAGITDIGMKTQIGVNDIISDTDDPLSLLKKRFHIG